MTTYENVESLIHSLAQKDYASAEQTFNAIMADKINSAIENVKVDIADDMFNQQGAIAEEVELSESNFKNSFLVRGQYSDKDGNLCSVNHKVHYVEDGDHAKRIATMRAKETSNYPNYVAKSAKKINRGQ